MTDQETTKALRLNGKKTYPGWKKITLLTLANKGYLTPKTKVIATGSEDDALFYVMNSLSFEIAGIVPDYEGCQAVLAWLENEYGETDVWALEKDLKSLKMVEIDPEDYFIAYNQQYALLAAAGKRLSASDQVGIILDCINSSFYVDKIRSIRVELQQTKTEDIDAAYLASVKKTIRQHFNATPKEVRDSYTRTKSSSNNVDERPTRLCNNCKKNKRNRVMKSHNDSQCFYHDGPGFVKKDSVGSDVSNQVTRAANKESNHYFTAYHDSGSTPRSYFKDKPQNFKTGHGTVFTADANGSAKVTGTGEAKFGDLHLTDIVHVPSFSKNLVSGIQIMKQGYKQEIYNDKLIISKDGQICATGTYEDSTGLLKMDQSIQPYKECSNSASLRSITRADLHHCLGHPGDQMLERTLPAISGIAVVGSRLQGQPLCDSCERGKATKQNRILHGTPATEILEIVDMDSQGPFPI